MDFFNPEIDQVLAPHPDTHTPYPETGGVEHHTQEHHHQQQVVHHQNTHHTTQHHDDPLNRATHTQHKTDPNLNKNIKQQPQSGGNIKGIASSLLKASYLLGNRIDAAKFGIDVTSMATEVAKHIKGNLTNEKAQQIIGYYYQHGHIGENGKFYSKPLKGHFDQEYGVYVFDKGAYDTHESKFNHRSDTMKHEKFHDAYNKVTKENKVNSLAVERAKYMKKIDAWNAKSAAYKKAHPNERVDVKDWYKDFSHPERWSDLSYGIYKVLHPVAGAPLKVQEGLYALIGMVTDFVHGKTMASGEDNLAHKMQRVMHGLYEHLSEPTEIQHRKSEVIDKVKNIGHAQELINKFKIGQDQSHMSATEKAKLKANIAKLSQKDKDLLKTIGGLGESGIELVKNLNKNDRSHSTALAIADLADKGAEMAVDLALASVTGGLTKIGTAGAMAVSTIGKTLAEDQLLYDYYSDESHLKEIQTLAPNDEYRKKIEGIIAHPNHAYLHALINGGVTAVAFGAFKEAEFVAKLPWMGGVFQGIGGGTVVQAMRSVMDKVGIKNASSFLAKSFADMHAGTRIGNMVKDMISEGLDMSAISGITTGSNEIAERLLYNKPMNGRAVVDAIGNGFVESLYFSGPRNLKHGMGYISDWASKYHDKSPEFGHYFDVVQKITNINIEDMSPEQLIAQEKQRNIDPNTERAKKKAGQVDIISGDLQKYTPKGTEASNEDSIEKHVKYAREALDHRTDLTKAQKDRAVSIAVQIYNHAKSNEVEMKQTLKEFAHDILSSLDRHSDSAKATASFTASMARDVLKKYDASRESGRIKIGAEGEERFDTDFLKLQRELRKILPSQMGKDKVAFEKGGLRTQAEEDAVASVILEYVNAKVAHVIETQKTALDPKNLERLADKVKANWHDVEGTRNEDDHESIKELIGENRRSKVAFEMAKENLKNAPEEEQVENIQPEVTPEMQQEMAQEVPQEMSPEMQQGMQPEGEAGVPPEAQGEMMQEGMPQEQGMPPEQGMMPQEEGMAPEMEGQEEMQPQEEQLNLPEDADMYDVVNAQLKKEIDKMKEPDFKGATKMAISELVDEKSKEHASTHKESALHIKHVGVAVLRFNDQIEAVEGAEQVSSEYYDPASGFKIYMDFDPLGELESEDENEEVTTGTYKVRIELRDSAEYTEDIADNFYEVVDAAHAGFQSWLEQLKGVSESEAPAPVVQEETPVVTNRDFEGNDDDQIVSVDINALGDSIGLDIGNGVQEMTVREYNQLLRESLEKKQSALTAGQETINESSVVKVECRPTPTHSNKEFRLASNPLIDKSKFEGGSLSVSKNWNTIDYASRFPKYDGFSVVAAINDAIAITQLPSRDQRQEALQHLIDTGQFEFISNVFPLKVGIDKMDFYIADMVTGKGEKYLKEKARLVKEFILGGGKDIPVAEVSRSFHNPTHLKEPKKISGNETAVIYNGEFQKGDKWGGATVKLPSGAVCTFPGTRLGPDQHKFMDSMAAMIIKYVVEGPDATVSPKDQSNLKINTHGYTHNIKDLLDTFFSPSKYLSEKWMDDKGYDKSQFLYYDSATRIISFYNEVTDQVDVYNFNKITDPTKVHPALARALVGKYIKIDADKANGTGSMGHPVTIGEVSIKPDETYKDFLVRNGFIQTDTDHLNFRDPVIHFSFKLGEPTDSDIANKVTGGTSVVDKVNTTGKIKIKSTVTDGTSTERPIEIVGEKPEISNTLPAEEPDDKIVDNPIEDKDKPRKILTESGAVVRAPSTDLPTNMKHVGTYTSYKDAVKAVSVSLLEKMIGGQDPTGGDVNWAKKAIADLMKGEIDTFKSKLADPNIAKDENAKAFYEKAVNIRTEMAEHADQVATDVLSWIKDWGGLKEFTNSFEQDDEFGTQFNYTVGRDMVDPLTFCSERLDSVMAILSTSQLSETTTFPTFYDHGKVANLLMREFGGKASSLEDLKTLIEKKSKESSIVRKFWDKIQGDDELLRASYSLFSKQVVNFADLKVKKDGTVSISESKSRGAKLIDKWTKGLFNRWEGAPPEEIEASRKGILAAYDQYGRRVGDEPMAGQTMIESSVQNGATFKDYVDAIVTVLHTAGIPVTDNTAGILEGVAETYVQHNNNLFQQFTQGGPGKDLSLIFALEGAMRGYLSPAVDMPDHLKGLSPSVFAEAMNIIKFIGEGSDVIVNQTTGKQMKKTALLYQKSPTLRRLCTLLSENGAELKPSFVWGPDHTKRYIYRDPCALSDVFQHDLSNPDYVKKLASNEYNMGNETLKRLSGVFEAGGKQTGLKMQEVLNISGWGGKKVGYRDASGADIMLSHINAILQGKAVYRQMSEKPKFLLIEGIANAPTHLSNYEFGKYLINGHIKGEMTAIDTAHKARANFLNHLGAGDGNTISKKDIEQFNNLSGEHQMELIRDAKYHTLKEFGLREGYHYKYVDEKEEGGRVTGHKIELSGKGYGHRMFDCLPEWSDAVTLTETAEDRELKISALCASDKIINAVYDNLNKTIGSFLENLAKKGIIRLQGNTGDDRLMDVRHNINPTTRKPFFEIPDDTELGDAAFDLIQQRVEKYKTRHGDISDETVPLMVALRKVALSSIWHDLEMNGLIEGDPAAMGGYANQTKRVQGLNSPGIKFANDFPEGHEFFGKKTYKRLHIHDPVINNPEIADVIAEKRAKAMAEIAKDQPRFKGKSAEDIYNTCLQEAKETVKGIANTMPTDGQSLITPSAAREWLIRLHRWSPAQEEAFQSWKDGKSSGDVLDNIMSTVLKCVYWGEETANQAMPDGTVVPLTAPEFHKTSYALLFSNDKSSWNHKLMEWAEKNKVDVIACGSASKTFGTDRMELINADGQLIDGFDGASHYVDEHSFDNLRWQVPLPAHGQTMDHLGRQPGNIIFSGANKEQASTLGKHYVNIMQSIIDGHLSEGNMSRTLFSMGVKGGDATDNSIEAYAQGVPIGWIKNRALIDNTLRGVSKCLQTTLPSVHAVEVTAIGRHNLQMIDKHGLAEIEVNMNQLAFMFPKGSSFGEAKAFFDKAKEDLGGKIEGLHYRVPTQGITSMAHTNVKDIIPNTGGDVIHAPFELAHVLGSDKDGDTLYGHGMRYVWKCTDPENMKTSAKMLGSFLKHINGRTVTSVPGERGIGAVKDKVDFDYIHEAHKWAMDHHAVYDEKTGNFLIPKKGQELIDNIKYVELGYEGEPNEYAKKRDTSYVYHGNKALKEMFKIMGTDKAVVQETSSVDGPVKAAKEYIYSITPNNELSGLMKLGVNGREISRTNNQGSQDDIGPSAITGKVIGLFNIITEGKSLIEQLQEPLKKEGASITKVNTGLTVKNKEGKNMPLFVNVSLANEKRADGGGLFNVDGKLIGDDLTALISMAVDGGKDPVLPQGNIYKKTIGAVCLLQAEGYGNTAYALVNAPIVRDLVDMPMSDEPTAAQEKALLMKYFSLPEQATDSDLVLKMKDIQKTTLNIAESRDLIDKISKKYKEYMDEGVPFDKWTSEFKEDNIKAYFLFKAAKTEGQILANVANIMQIDGDGVGKTYGKCFRTWKNLKELGVVDDNYNVIDGGDKTPPLAKALMKTYIGEKVGAAGKIMRQLQEEGDLGFSAPVFKVMDHLVETYLPFAATDDMVDDAHKAVVRSAWAHTLDKIGVDIPSLYIGDNTLFDAFWLLDTKGALDPNNEAVAHIVSNTPRLPREIKTLSFDVKDITDNKMEGHMMDALRRMEKTASFQGAEKEFNDFKAKLVLYSYVADGNNTISHLLPPEWIKEVPEIQQASMYMRSMIDEDYPAFEQSIISNIPGAVDVADGKIAVDTPDGMKIGGATLDVSIPDPDSKLPSMFSAMLKFKENGNKNPEDELQIVRYKMYGLESDVVALYKNFGGDLWVKVPDNSAQYGSKFDTAIAGVVTPEEMEDIFADALKQLSNDEREWLRKTSKMDVKAEIERIDNRDLDRKEAYFDQPYKPASEQPSSEMGDAVEPSYDEDEIEEVGPDGTGTKEDLTYKQPMEHFKVGGKDIEIYDDLSEIDMSTKPTVIGDDLVKEYKASCINKKFTWKDMLKIIENKMKDGDNIAIGGVMEIPPNQVTNLNNILHKFGVHATKADWTVKPSVTFAVAGSYESGGVATVASPEYLQKMGERANAITKMTVVEIKNMNDPYTSIVQNVGQLQYITEKRPEIMQLMSSIIASNGEMAPIDVAKEAGFDAAAISKYAHAHKGNVIMEHILKTHFAKDGLEDGWIDMYREMGDTEKSGLVDKMLNC